MVSERRIFSTDEVAEILRCSKNRLYQLIQEKQIGHYKSKRKYTFSQRHINNYLQKKEIPMQSIPKETLEIIEKFLANKPTKGGSNQMGTSAEKKSKSEYWDCGIGKIYIKGYQRNGSESFYIRYYDESGQRISRKAKGCNTLKEAKLALLEAVKEIQRYKDMATGKKADISLGNIMSECRAHLKVDVMKAYDYSISNFFNEEMLLSEITSRTVDEYIAWMEERGNSPKTVVERLKALRKILKKADEYGYKLFNYENPVKIDKFPKVPKKAYEKVILAEEDEQRLLNCCESHIRPIVITALETGMRLNEILNLKWDEVEMNKGITLSAERCKDREARFIPFSPRLNLMFKELFLQKQNIKESQYYSSGDKDYVFLYHKLIRKGMKKWIHPTVIRRSFLNALKKAGLQGQITFHSFRHTFVTRWIKENKGSIVALNLITGHNHINMTQHYSHPSKEDLCEIVNGNGKNGTRLVLEQNRKSQNFLAEPILLGENR